METHKKASVELDLNETSLLCHLMINMIDDWQKISKIARLGNKYPVVLERLQKKFSKAHNELMSEKVEL